MTEGYMGDLSEFLTTRQRWYSIRTIEDPGGSWHVMLRLDGTYNSQEDAQRVAEFFLTEYPELGGQ